MSYAKADCIRFRQEIMPKIVELLKEHGIAAVDERMTYGNEGMSVKLRMTPLAASGHVPSREEARLDKGAEDFKQFAEMYGLKKEDLGRWIRYGGGRYQIVGLKMSARVNVVMLRGGRGASYVASVAQVKSAASA